MLSPYLFFLFYKFTKRRKYYEGNKEENLRTIQNRKLHDGKTETATTVTKHW